MLGRYTTSPDYEHEDCSIAFSMGATEAFASGAASGAKTRRNLAAISLDMTQVGWYSSRALRRAAWTDL